MHFARPRARRNSPRDYRLPSTGVGQAPKKCILSGVLGVVVLPDVGQLPTNERLFMRSNDEVVKVLGDLKGLLLSPLRARFYPAMCYNTDSVGIVRKAQIMKTYLGLIILFFAFSSLLAGEIPTQFIIAKDGNQLVTPAVSSTPPGGVLIEVKPYYAAKPTKLERIRKAFGGAIPYVVVKSEKLPFVIMTQEKDVLVVGHPQPRRVVLREATSYRVVQGEGCPVIVPSSDAHTLIVEQTDKLEVRPELPSWLPTDILKSRTSYKDQETVYRPNQRLAHSGSDVVIDGIKYECFKLPFTDY